MAIRVIQVCGLWFWVAFMFFIFVVLHQSQALLPSAINSQKTPPINSSPIAIKSKGLTTHQRMLRAEKSWQSSVSLRHEMAAKHPGYPQVPLFPAQKLDDFGKYPYTIWDFFPATYTCPHDIQRVGRLGDGGKWVCGMSLFENKPAPAVSRAETSDNPSTIIYSFGVNDESTFEAEMLARIPSAQIFAFDYSVTSFGPQLPASFSARAHFRQVGLSWYDEMNRSPKFFSLQTLMMENKHTYMDILKIDVEGAEYQAFDGFMDWCDKLNGGVMPIGQIMIELHLVDDKIINFERFLAWWERLEGFGMRPTWLEINLLAVTLAGGKTDPRCVEYVFVNHKDQHSILLQE